MTQGSLMKGSLRTHLKDKLEPNELRLLYTSYDIVGDIAIIQVPETLKLRTQAIAKALLQTQKHVKTVLRQISPVAGDFRLRDLEWIAGEKKTETVYKEFGCLFKVDLVRCYFSPRLFYERMRITKLIQPNEVIVIMPLPEKAYEYIETALLALKSRGGVIHYYGFEYSANGENAIEKTRKRVSEKLETLGVNFDLLKSRIVRTTGPNWHQIALDIQTS